MHGAVTYKCVWDTLGTLTGVVLFCFFSELSCISVIMIKYEVCYKTDCNYIFLFFPNRQ